MSGADEVQALERAASFLRERLADRVTGARIAIVLGSGLKGFAARVDQAQSIPFGEVPGWPAPKVEGHGGALVTGLVGTTPVVCLTGRVHLYEGWSPAEVVRPVRTLRHLGVPAFLLTNAAGGISDDLSAGDLMLITDHLNLTGCSPLVGAHAPELGPRFPDQTAVYSPRLRALLEQGGVRLRPGVYAGLLGPSYETPAEVRMVQALGADAVGMSTVHEAMALNAMAGEVVGLSLVTNLAAGIGDSPLSHAEVVATGAQAAATLEGLVTEFCRRL